MAVACPCICHDRPPDRPGDYVCNLAFIVGINEECCGAPNAPRDAFAVLPDRPPPHPTSPFTWEWPDRPATDTSPGA